MSGDGISSVLIAPVDLRLKRNNRLKEDKTGKTVMMRIEPSKRLSGILGFPYFIEESIPLSKLLEDKITTSEDVAFLESGKEICKQIPIKGG